MHARTWARFVARCMDEPGPGLCHVAWTNLGKVCGTLHARTWATSVARTWARSVARTWARSVARTWARVVAPTSLRHLPWIESLATSSRSDHTITFCRSVIQAAEELAAHHAARQVAGVVLVTGALASDAFAAITLSAPTLRHVITAGLLCIPCVPLEYTHANGKETVARFFPSTDPCIHRHALVC